MSADTHEKQGPRALGSRAHHNSQRVYALLSCLCDFVKSADGPLPWRCVQLKRRILWQQIRSKAVL